MTFIHTRKIDRNAEERSLISIEVEEKLEQLPEMHRLLLRMMFGQEYPDDYVSKYPDNTAEIAKYIGIRFRGKAFERKWVYRTLAGIQAFVQLPIGRTK